MANSVQVSSLTLEGAREVAHAALEAATNAGIKVSMAVLDAAGRTKVFIQMDGAVPSAAQVALDKAVTVVGTGIPTHLLGAGMQQKPTALVISTLKIDQMQILGGGVPVAVDGEVVGAIGVSGGTAEQDQEAAEAGAAAVA
jgi:glc operon protein GlcG